MSIPFWCYLGYGIISDTPPYEKMPFEVPQGWVWTTLGDYLELISGQDFPPEKYNNKQVGIPYVIGASNIDNEQLIINRWTENPSVCSNYNDLLVVCKGAGVGKMAINNIGKVHIARQIQAVRTFTNCINIYYIKAVIKNNIENIISNANGLIPGLKRELLLSLQIPLPPLNEQYRIVAEIERWFALIDHIERGKTDLKTAIKQAKNKILDLAIHGKLVSQDPNDEPASELLKRINPKAEITCDNGRYGKVPEGWCVCHINDVSSSSLGKTLDKGKNIGSLKKYLCALNVQWGYFDLSTIKQFRLEENEFHRYSIRKGDLLVCEGGDVGRAAIWESDGEFYYQNALHRVRFRENISEKWFMYHLRYLKNIGLIDEACKGVTIKHLTQNVLNSLYFNLPPLPEQRRIVAKIEELFAQFDSIEAALQA